ncbi:MAG: type II toxin-antitoxin system RelB/DinJ family antitoxin [Clostridia bacterium]|nr:type II toxin-antitoxin system RelB/DinJ family antitoxin [Clostridia bacterium]
MMNANLNIRTDKEVKENAEKIFSELGMSMTTAINLFLRQSIRFGGIPFELRVTPNAETLAAIEEGRIIARDESVKGYTDMESLIEALES